MPTQDVHKKINNLEAKIAKLGNMKQKAKQLKSNVKKQRDQKSAKAIAEKLRNG